MINQGQYPYRFTIFIPTYNRAKLLPRAFKSVEQQSFRDFEVVIVDDGSSDNSREIIEAWQTKVDFPVTYHYQKNQGKPAAHNAGIERAQGFFIVNLDSDDLLASNALELLDQHWQNIPDTDKPQFAGVEGLCAMLSDHSIAGDRFPQDIFDSDYLELRLKLHISGDKKNAIRTDVLREFPFPLFKGEKDIRESIIWNRMAKKYKFRYINEIIEIIEYQPDGLSAGAFWRRLRSPQSYQLTYQELANDYADYYSRRQNFKTMAKYIRFSLHCGISFKQQRATVHNKKLWLQAIAKGYINYLSDCHKIKRAT